MEQKVEKVGVAIFIMVCMVFGCEQHKESHREFNQPQKENAPEKSRAEQAAEFEAHLEGLYDSINFKDLNLEYDAFRYGMIGYYNLRLEGRLDEREMISIIDFTKSSCDRRFYTIDLNKKEVVFYSLISHGVGTGDEYAQDFSNIPESRQSSIGMYVTGKIYQGKHGSSLRLHGVDSGYNEKAFERAIVMHGADYVDDNFVQARGMLGRSWGCPALPQDLNQEVIEAIKGNTLLFAYFSDDTYLNASSYLDLEKVLELEAKSS